MKKSIILMIVVMSFLIQLASAEFWACFQHGQVINYCNPKTPDRTCGSENGCLMCMDSFNDQSGCYNQGNFNACNVLPPVCYADNDSDMHLDISPPILTILSPINKHIYNKKSIPLTFSLNERSSVYFIDANDPKDSWHKICSSCMAHDRVKYFEEGANRLLFKAIDAAENEAYYNINITIDSKKPRILRVLPMLGFTNGKFELEFKEDHPKSLKIFIGNSKGDFAQLLNISHICQLNKSKYYCYKELNLSLYENSEIEYWFNLTDIADSSDSSKKSSLIVDTVPPVISSITYALGRRIAEINISITEKNPLKITYINHDDDITREKIFCSRPNAGTCNKKITLKNLGQNQLEFFAYDKAGNIASKKIIITV